MMTFWFVTFFKPGRLVGCIALSYFAQKKSFLVMLGPASVLKGLSTECILISMRSAEFEICYFFLLHRRMSPAFSNTQISL